MMNYLDELADATVYILYKLGGLLHYLVRLNYELVSFLLDIIHGVLWLFTNIVIGLRVALSEFVEQYGEWCTSALSYIWWTVSSVFTTLRSAVYVGVNVVLAIGRLLYLMVTVPVEWARNFVAFMSSAYDKFDLINMPVHLLNGIQMVFSGLWEGVIFCFSSIYCGFLGMLNGCVYVISSIAGGVWYVVTRPFDMCGKVLKFAVDLPSDAIFGLLVCVVVLYLFKLGVISALCRFLSVIGFKLFSLSLHFGTQCYLTFVSWFVFFSLELLAIFVPWVAVGLRLFRLVSGPVLGIFLRITGFLRLRSGSRPDALRRRPIVRSPRTFDESISEDRLVCVACVDNEKSVILLPCGHLCLCPTCSEWIMSHDQQCPMCRRKIREAVDAYF